VNFCLIDTAAIIGSNYPLWAISGTFAPQKVMSALPPMADIRQCKTNVRFVPKADII